MKEYTFIALLSVLLVAAVDSIMKTRLFRLKLFWFFILVIIFFKVLVNGYLTGANIIVYNPRYFMGLRAGSIPLEDFLFGFSLVSLTLIFWEYFKRRKA